MTPESRISHELDFGVLNPPKRKSLGNRFAAGHWRFKGHMAGRTRGGSGMTGIALFVAAFFSYHSGMCTGSQKFGGLGGQNVPHNCASARRHAALTSSFLDETRCAETWGYVLPAAPFGARRAGMTRFFLCTALSSASIDCAFGRACACVLCRGKHTERDNFSCMLSRCAHACTRASKKSSPSLPPYE